MITRLILWLYEDYIREYFITLEALSDKYNVWFFLISKNINSNLIFFRQLSLTSNKVDFSWPAIGFSRREESRKSIPTNRSTLLIKRSSIFQLTRARAAHTLGNNVFTFWTFRRLRICHFLQHTTLFTAEHEGL